MRENEKQKNKTWSFIQLGKYEVPRSPASEAIRMDVLGVVYRITKSIREISSKDCQKDLDLIPRQLLDKLTPEIDVTYTIEALDEELKSWLEDGEGNNVRIILSAPHSGTDDVVDSWAKGYGFPVLNPPTDREILKFDTIYDPDFDEKQDPIVIPNLEKFFLRHHNSLDTIRQLIEKVAESEKKFLICCNSWAWKYLDSVINLGVIFSEPIALQPLDSCKLDVLFREMADSFRVGIKFRQADNGKLVIRSSADEEIYSKKKYSDFLVHLASYSRGIPEVSREIWRYSLRLEPMKDSEKEIEKKIKSERREPVIWVKPWSRISLPNIPGSFEKNTFIFILSSLLIHNGLSTDTLVEILPFSKSEILYAIKSLEKLRIISMLNDQWRVTPISYPSVRSYLSTEGYLVDSL